MNGITFTRYLCITQKCLPVGTFQKHIKVYVVIYHDCARKAGNGSKTLEIGYTSSSKLIVAIHSLMLA